jgi:hypothetical protein
VRVWPAVDDYGTTCPGLPAMIDVTQLNGLIAAGEALQREFKSDRRRIGDSEIYEEVVALANTDGGVLLIGVEDDGTVTGAKARHGKTTDPFKLQAAIFNNTVPSINTRVSVVPHPQGLVIGIEVDLYPEPCATAAGKSVRRAIGPHGRPQTVPFYPRDQRSRRVALGLLDFSAQVLDATSFEDLDPLAFERMRQTIARQLGQSHVVRYLGFSCDSDDDLGPEPAVRPSTGGPASLLLGVRQQGGLTIRASPIAMVIGVGTMRWAAAPCLR